ncbi:MAG: pyruvate, phosphate dikinase [Bacteroidia bacterium]|nr:pyruvate, phosphate dikinase [Bacteroidia bacterium]
MTSATKYILLVFLFVLAGCGRWSHSTGPADDKRFAYLPQLEKVDDFRKLEGRPLSDKFSHIRSVKVVYDLHSKKLYFVNGNHYTYHHEFAEQVLGYGIPLYEFNERNYGAGKLARDLLLGNLNHVQNTKTWFLELSPSDQMDIPYIETLYRSVKENCAFGDSLRFYVNNLRLLQAAEKGTLKLPLIRSEGLFGSLLYQQVSAGETGGILKRYTLDELKNTVPDRNEIILLNGTPLSLPDVKGIIVTELQTPLSHLVLLGRNRGIPVAVCTQAWDDPRLATLEGKKVEFKTLADSMQLRENAALQFEEKPVRTIVLEKDLSKKGLISMDKVPDLGLGYVGAKAYNFACLAAISRKKQEFRVPEYAFAIPFWYYAQHVEQSGALKLIVELDKNSATLKEDLKAVRKKIQEYPVDPELLRLVEERMNAQAEFAAFRFRSSTNAEDLSDFNGAGLYDSKSAVKGDTSKTVANAIRKVWASTWSPAAYREREIFGIDQRSVAMGILVHRSFPEEEANGVVVTQNLYRDYDGITVNVQKGESSVVLPEKGITTEIFTAYPFEQPPWDGELVLDYVSHSPLNDYKPLLSEAEIKKLYSACMAVRAGMRRYWGEDAVCDIEFKLVGPERKLYLKQVRIY